MRKFFRALEMLSVRTAGPDYPHATRPIIKRNREPGISIKPFTKVQIEGIRKITKRQIESAFMKHLSGSEFKTKVEYLGSEPVFFILPYPAISMDGPSYILISRLPAEIEFNFKRSSCNMSKESRRKYFLFLRELLELGKGY